MKIAGGSPMRKYFQNPVFLMIATYFAVGAVYKLVCITCIVMLYQKVMLYNIRKFCYMQACSLHYSSFFVLGLSRCLRYVTSLTVFACGWTK
jgi:hypothetical protein